jgi:hypothetical protein
VVTHHSASASVPRVAMEAFELRLTEFSTPHEPRQRLAS